jgi:hypothetical protein
MLNDVERLGEIGKLDEADRIQNEIDKIKTLKDDLIRMGELQSFN